MELQSGRLPIGAAAGAAAAAEERPIMMQFTNIIAYSPNPFGLPALTLAAHYDSLQLKHASRPFIGATDSAASVAILLTLAKMLTCRQETHRTQQAPICRIDRISIERPIIFILFDGEEAFHQWSAKDSVYGSRLLAKEWSSTCLPLQPQILSNLSATTKINRQQKERTKIDLISQLVLLDLLGANDPWPTIHDYFHKHEDASGSRGLGGYADLVRLESQMNRRRLLSAKRRQRVGGERYFVPFKQDPVMQSNAGGGGGGGEPRIDDDHRPLMEVGVRRVLHLIPFPFPAVWHTVNDDSRAVDVDIVRDFLRIIYGYVELYFV